MSLLKFEGYRDKIQRLKTRLGREQTDEIGDSGWLFVLPALFFYIPFLIVPAVSIFVLSFFRWEGLGSMVFVGFSNYVSIFQDEVFWQALGNNVTMLVLHLVMMAGGGLVIAYAIHNSYDRLRPVLQIGILLPMAIMSVGVGFIWSFMYHPRFGVLNNLLSLVNIDPIIWLGNPDLALYSIILTAAWQWTGYTVVIWQAGIDSIDDRYYEAARLDGAGRLQMFRYISLPLLKPIAVFVTVFITIGAFKAYALFWVMTRGGPDHASEVMVTWIYKVAFDVSNFGMASAISAILFIITLIASIIGLKAGNVNGDS